MWLLFLILGGILLLLLWFLRDNVFYAAKYPPGPIRFPLLGNLPQLAMISPHSGIAFNELSKTYGDVFYFRLGVTDLIVCNSFESISEIRDHKFALERALDMLPTYKARKMGKNSGLIFAIHGEDKNSLKRWTVRTLREQGFGKTAYMEQLINLELENFLLTLKSSSKKESSSSGEMIIEKAVGFFDLTTTKTLLRYVYGWDYGIEDEKMRKLLRMNHELLNSFNVGMSVSIAFPFLYSLFPFLMGKKREMECFRELKNFMKELTSASTSTSARTRNDFMNDPQTYLESFLGKIATEEEEKNKDTLFTEEQLTMVLFDFFQAGGSTTSTLLTFCVLYMLVFEEIQEKVRNELDQNLNSNFSSSSTSGGDESIPIINLSMKDELPYTYATVLECFRFCSLAPTALPHVTSEDFYYRGYLFRKGMFVICNFYGANFCEKTWGDPHNFRPERFLNKEDGSVNVEMQNKIIVFGIGPRMCLGRPLGENLVFSYFASLIKNFKLEKVEESDKVSTDAKLGATQIPMPFRFKLVARR